MTPMHIMSLSKNSPPHFHSLWVNRQEDPSQSKALMAAITSFVEKDSGTVAADLLMDDKVYLDLQKQKHLENVSSTLVQTPKKQPTSAK